VICRVCGATDLAVCFDGAGLGSVTSDCRPWSRDVTVMTCSKCGILQKPEMPGVADAVAAVYAGYDIYRLSGGEEQAIFSGDGIGIARSRRLVQRLRELVPLPSTGALLDVGCGNGATLRAFGAELPGWRMSGFEIDDRSRRTVLALPGVVGFHAGRLEDVDGAFDLLSFVHVLEHIPAPWGALGRARELLRADGLLLIQVPNVLANAFDLGVMDHFFHFTAPHLEGLLVAAGFEPLVVSTEVITKELTAIARPAPGPATASIPAGDGAIAAALGRQGEWLHRTHAAVRRAAQAPRFGIFGTAIAGTWLGMTAGERLGYFVDEDVARVGRRHLDVPVRHPGDLRAEDRVFLAFPAPVARGLNERLRASYCADFIMPPAETA
jgi:SAM-dependent methyltransferase